MSLNNFKILLSTVLLIIFQIVFSLQSFTQNSKKLYPHQKEKEYGLLDSNGHLVVDYIYDFISPFKNGVAVAGKNGKFGFINYNGKEIIALQYDTIKYCFPNLYIISNGDSSNITDTLGKLLLKEWYYNIDAGWDQIFLITKSSNNKLVDLTNTIRRYNLQDIIGLDRDSILYGNYLYGYFSNKHPELNGIWFSGGTDFYLGSANIAISNHTYSIDTNGKITHRISSSCDPTLREVYIPDEPPIYPGGEQALNKFLKDNLKYPENADVWYHNTSISVQICITETGEVKPSIAKPLNPDYDKQILNAFLKMPKWTPAKYKGKPICSCFIYSPRLYLRGYKK